jgi:hypothetical protein
LQTGSNLEQKSEVASPVNDSLHEKIGSR